MLYSIGDTIKVQSYKHDKSLHRIWETSTVLDINTKGIVLANAKTKVIESNGRYWFTKEPSVTYFFKDCWFNIIGIIKPEGISYYCNISSPYVIDDEAIKYIDYDLDLKVFSDNTYSILDRNEYNRNKELMDYPSKLGDILEVELKKLIQMVKDNLEPFGDGFIENWYNIYKKM